MRGDLNNDPDLDRDARDWVLLISSGEATRKDAEQLQLWCARSPKHQAAFDRAAQLWQLSGPALPAPTPPPVREATRRGILFGAIGISTVAAGSQVAAALGVIPTWTALASDHATALGESRRLALYEGLDVHLDGGSAISEFRESGRETLRLDQGAAFFESIQPKHSWATFPQIIAGPCLVETPQPSIFEIVRRDDIAVSCAAGQIAVTCGGTMTLSSGETVRCSEAGLTTKLSFTPSEISSWRNRELIFRDAPFADVVTDLNRHRLGRIVIGSEALRDRRVSGSVGLDDPASILSTLRLGLALRMTPSIGGVVIVY